MLLALWWLDLWDGKKLNKIVFYAVLRAETERIL